MARSRLISTSELRPGDQFELRGPIGGYFVWTAATGRAALLVAGGSGIVPLMAMLRHRARRRQQRCRRACCTLRAPARTSSTAMNSTGSPSDGDGLTVVHTLTREPPAGLDRPHAAASTAPCWRKVGCPSGASAANLRLRPDAAGRGGGARRCVELGHEPARIKTERFGPTGK